MTRKVGSKQDAVEKQKKAVAGFKKKRITRFLELDKLVQKKYI